MSAALKQYSATGRRKTSVARVTLIPGTGLMTVNGRSCEEYFPTVSLQNTVNSPLLLVSGQRFDITVAASGGGINGQVGAVRLGIARALLQFDADLRPGLKHKGFLTRDPRMKERKKPGRPGARKRFQFSKR